MLSHSNSFESKSGKVINITDTIAFKKRKEHIKKAFLSTLEEGTKVELIGNSRNIKLLEHRIGSKGTILCRLNAKKKSIDGSVDYIVMFGDLNIDVNSNDLMVVEE